MRAAALLILVVWPCAAQFRTTSPLVIAPTSVTDSKGNFVDGLTENDLLLYDNNVRQPIQLDWAPFPISLVVAVQSGKEAEAVMLKLEGSGILLTNFVAADQGETAVISFSDEVRVRNDFTSNPDAVTKSLRGLGVEGDGACELDALMRALRMLGTRKAARRRVIFMIAEKRDRGSITKLPEVVKEIQRQNAAVYWLTFSPTLTAYTERPQKVKSKDPDRNGQPIPFDPPPFNFLNVFSALAHESQPNLADLFTAATGGHTRDFLDRKALEQEIHMIGDEVHRQYIVSFQPPKSEAGLFHSVRVEVMDRPELTAKTRQGYWAVD